MESDEPSKRTKAHLLRTWWPCAAAPLSGLLLTLCFAPWDRSGFVWIWAAPLLTALWFAAPRKAKTPRWQWGFGLGYLAGLAHFLASLPWFLRVGDVAQSFAVGLLAWVGVCAYLALYFGVFGAFAATAGRWIPLDASGREQEGGFSNPPSSADPTLPKTSRRRAGTPSRASRKRDLFGQSLGVLRAALLNGAAWCGLEWLRGVLFTGFPWNGLGVALKDHLLLVQFADVIGVTGYGFVLMFSGCVLFATVVRLVREVKDRKRMRPHFDFALGVVMIIGLFLYGLDRINRVPEKTIDLRVRLIQPNIPLDEKWSNDGKVLREIVDDYRDLTRTFVEVSEHDLVLWPETSLPGLFSFPWVQDLLNDEVLAGLDFHLLAGLEDEDFVTGEIHNEIFLMRGSTEDYQHYRKAHLVPFGEYLPFRDRFPPVEWLLGDVVEEDFSPGSEREPLVMEKDGREIGIIPLICFEDILARHARRFVRDGPQLIANVTNDGWFDPSHEPQQHFDNARFRCIELRRPMARATNTGVSGFIDQWGSVHDRHAADRFERILRDSVTGDTRIRGSLPATLRLDPDPPVTLYARFGDAFSIALGLVAIGTVLLRATRRVR